ncbi:MAG: SGNH/GDSL hydrolase family protein [Christensenellaceae bacterium]|nr:SGNH/GDSL hydrolase family protein [Christensenellaceae bacterium]
MKPKAKKIIAALTALVLSLSCLFVVQALVTPKYMSGVLEGGMVAEYYDETTDHDVIFVGDCEVYENFSPITLWEEYGITSYIRGSAQQLIWQSYYLLEETFTYESPDVVVFNVLSMKYGQPQSEAYNRMTLDGMKLTPIKMAAVKASMTEEETAISYVFPLLRYHSRITQLTDEDFTYAFRRDKITHNGYLMRVDVEPMTQLPTPAPLMDYAIDPVCFEYLDKMAALCEENGAQLILVKSPSLYPHWYAEWDAQIVEYANKKGLPYYNYIETMDDMGIDMSTDTYDGGLHLNLWGAEKLSREFGRMLAEDYGVADHRGEPEYDKVWTDKVDFYYNMIEAQQKELEEYGYLKSWTLGE